MILNNELKNITNNFQVDYFGVADISNYENDLAKFGGEIVKGYKFGISIGIVLPNTIVDSLKNRFDKNVSSLYFTHSYHIINDRLNLICSILSSYLNNKGYDTLPIPSAERTDIENAIPTVSHKMIANLAGLGWIGKNCLLITPEHGPRLRLISLLTNAPLEITGSLMKQRCNNCTECVKICPANAIEGINFEIEDEREKRLNFKKCHNYFEEMKKDYSRKPICGMCLYICPYGKKKKQYAHSDI
ncbi:MAG: 4Fe-4S ferredoxin [Spirochaetes bacterium GWD1_27_9]|nr:MAG: 4Fe-4S ferredoxin [Spirochaetes bacterium GWD1_27_9]